MLLSCSSRREKGGEKRSRFSIIYRFKIVSALHNISSTTTLGPVVGALENDGKIVSLGSGLGGQSLHFVVSVVKGLLGGIVAWRLF
mmetsp:Transcript_28859/g.40564  ORF Transcript_28859/g.40564 Transcript_28859/m.40564 type:complete len:86 (-) Transcript_28859:608-865(-)